MGQLLPLPERIPAPTGSQKFQLSEMGILILDDQNPSTNPPPEYVRYSLPTGWKMVDKSWRQDLPNFVIVDTDDMIRVTIQGSWKGSYDNTLDMCVNNTPYEKLVRPTEEVIPSETDLAAFTERVDPLNRPRTEVYRRSDYSE